MATPPQQPPPPGWYPDPQAQGAERWWDGTQWTANQRPVGAPSPVAVPHAMSPSDEKTWAVIAHLSALAAMLIGFAFLGPLVVYLIKKDDSPYVRQHAAAALNFQLSWLIWGIVLAISGVILLFVLIGFVLLFCLLIGLIAWLVFVILAAVKANNCELYKYPLTVNFVS